MSDKSEQVSLGLIWGMPVISKATGRTERALYHLVERAKEGKGTRFPGLKKIGGKWRQILPRFGAFLRRDARARDDPIAPQW